MYCIDFMTLYCSWFSFCGQDTFSRPHLASNRSLRTHIDEIGRILLAFVMKKNNTRTHN